MRKKQSSECRKSEGACKSPTLFLFALFVLLLGFSVVCWGLHDKLSLYAPSGASATVAKAKLLTERERPAMQVALVAPQPPTPATPVFFLLFAALLPMLFASRLQKSLLISKPRFRQPQAQSFHEALHRRPPPVSIRAFAAQPCIF